MSTRSATLIAALMLTLPAGRALAQSASVGAVACEDCSRVAELPAPTLWGFKLAEGNLDALPDVLFDESNVGGVRNVGLLVGAGWNFDPSWRIAQRDTDSLVVIVLDEGVLAFDSTANELSQFDLGLVTPQPACAFGGGVAPRVRDIPGGRAIEWNPVIEQNTDASPNGCTPAGSAARGFVIGYNVYRLAVAAFPAPTRRDFLVSGFIGHADVLRLDFGVVDPDGLSGSDRDPADNLILRNPDGLPDTGDEVLEWHDMTARAGLAWYRLQPVVRGDPAAVGHPRAPATRRDLDGDGVLESVDIFDDGFVEFIDPSGRGLGLTYGGEIASSLRAGLAEPAPGSLGCDGQLIGETDCANGVDDNGNGFVDCDDPACCGLPACVVAPPDVRRIDVARVRNTDAVVVTWTPAAPPPPGATFDVLSGIVASPRRGGPMVPGCLWGDRSIVAANCLTDDRAALSVDDPRAITPDVAGFYYLVRGQAPCGAAGDYGSDSLGRLRVPGAADCAR